MSKEPKTRADKLADKREAMSIMAELHQDTSYRADAKRVAQAKKGIAREVARENLTADCKFAADKRVAQAKVNAELIKADPTLEAILDPAKAKAKEQATGAAAKLKAAQAEVKSGAKVKALLVAAVQTLQAGGKLTKKMQAALAAASCTEQPAAAAPTEQPTVEQPAAEEPAGN